jgi:hypothetical protein
MHFIGDIHQPLHTEKLEHGGTGIEVHFDGKATNLHSVWDRRMVDKWRGREEWGRGGRESEEEAAFLWAQQLWEGDGKKKDLGAECTMDAAECALRWAEESNEKVCSAVFKGRGLEGVAGKDLAGEYYDEAVPVIDAAVLQGGRRLAAWLDLMARSDGEHQELVTQDL